MSKPEFTTEQLTRLVERRERIAPVLLRLWKVLDQHRELAHPQSTLAHLILGAAFSLWRAAFLIQVEPRQNVTSDARDFLQVLLRDNVITYPQDRDTRQWSGGYYLNSAYHRLALAVRYLPGGGSPHAEKIDAFVRSQGKGGVPNLEVGWSEACGVTEEVMSFLEDMFIRGGDAAPDQL